MTKPIPDRFAGRVALVTGAADGIGRAVAARFRAEGASVLAIDLVEEAVRAAFGDDPDVRAVGQDVTEPGAAERLVTAAREAFGGLDIVVNNAGIVRYEPTESMTDETWSRTLDVNLSAVFRLCRAAVPALVERGAGRIVNIASINAVRSAPGLAAYAATKAGVGALTKTLAVELGPRGITANFVLPGAILTGMTRPLMQADAATRALFEGFSAVGRIGQPDDIAAAVAFLASADAAFITGHGLVVDGGYLAKV